MTILIGVDVGGTFTDFLVWEDGRVRAHKRPSTPADPSRAVLEGVVELGVRPDLVVHSSTVATNAVLERRGARTALVTTEGVRDLLTIGRQTRPDIYDLEPETPEPLVAPGLTFELHGKLRPDGSVEEVLDHSEVRALVQQAEEEGAEALAVSLLYSYVNPTFEEVFEPVAGGTSLYLSLSSRVSPEYREVERTATTVLNAYVGPVMSRYVRHLSEGLAEAGAGPLRIVQSDGGAADPARASALPVATLLSGPSAGVAGAFAVARQAGLERVITFDMGGTSTDVALCDGAVPTRADVVIGGFAARTPVVDVHTVGAGGGSIARLDAGGALRVGPQSAGADPGPACYGRGDHFTVTDAQVVLGRLGAAGLLGGAMPLDASRSLAAAAPLLPAFEGDARAAAQAVIDVATANMERALRVVSVQRGFDPREFTLVAFGGAGPLHACGLAEALAMPRVLVPLMPGVLAAMGAAQSDLTATRSRSVLVPLDDASMPALLEALDRAGVEAREQLGETSATLEEALDVRYVGQSYELMVALDARDIEAAARAFHEAHEQRFAHSEPSAPLEAVNVRVTARVRSQSAMPAPEFARAGAAPVGTTQAWVGGRVAEAAVYDRAALAPGDVLDGPAIVTQLDTTTLVSPGWRGTVDTDGNLLLERA
ncbi:MAG: hydantoinase/oxoprolinase family protein [Dehalococcoidia bacterium]|nr:hydantoinase/oxoprolinase family protein [Dehalococcoidia bacterium]